ncbi:MAG: DUF4492 domain-containing protein [Desulfuromonadaceae bacterium]|nr:DUF4492 domain-containing protein [Desulfuromonadaceae bacterium]
MTALTRIWHFYRDGFRGMTLGKTLWTVILIKIIVLFGFLKLFFFPDLLGTRFDNDHDRGAFVLEHLVESAPGNRSRP